MQSQCRSPNPQMGTPNTMTGSVMSYPSNLPASYSPSQCNCMSNHSFSLTIIRFTITNQYNCMSSSLYFLDTHMYNKRSLHLYVTTIQFFDTLIRLLITSECNYMLRSYSFWHSDVQYQISTIVSKGCFIVSHSI